jgi:hypothetical protein
MHGCRALRKLREQGFDDLARGNHVHPEGLQPARFVGSTDAVGHRAVDPGVVDQQIHRAIADRGGQILAVAGAGHIQRHDGELLAMSLGQLHQVRAGFGVARAGKDAIAAREKLPYELQSDSPAASGDDDIFHALLLQWVGCQVCW